LLLLEETRAASIIDSAARYIEDKLIPGHEEVQEKELDFLADAICGLEYYLESRREHRMYGDSAMNVAEKGIETLGYPVQGEASEQPDMPTEDVPEDEAVLPSFDMDDDDSGIAEHAEELAEFTAEAEMPCTEGDDHGLTLIGEDIDEEIFEIFIEEAEEEIESLTRLLPQWINNNEDTDALETVRRSFHTLKGSGRLVGAMRIGEFAWAYENMLNRVIDGTIEVSDPVTDILGRVIDALVELVEEVKSGSRVEQPVDWLMRCAEAVIVKTSRPHRDYPLSLVRLSQGTRWSHPSWIPFP